MPKFVCSYAHDIACFADFVVEAKSENAALRQIRKALRDGKFKNVDATPAWENGATNERVFVQGEATEDAPDTTLERLIALNQSAPETTPQIPITTASTGLRKLEPARKSSPQEERIS